jgi:hypothetical protein
VTQRQLEQLLSALRDLQRSVDALGVDVEALRKCACKNHEEHPAPPGWVARASRAGREDEGDARRVADLHPPPAPGGGAAAAYLAIATTVALATLMALFVYFAS